MSYSGPTGGGAPPAGGAPGYGYQQPPQGGYQQPAQQPAQQYQQPPAGYQQPPGHQPPGAFQQPPAGAQQPPGGYQQPQGQYQQPQGQYQQPLGQYQQPQGQYQQPQGQYQQKPQGQYQQQPGGYQQAPPAGPPAHVTEWFKSIDSDNSGALDSKELQKALSMGNLKYALTDVDSMVRAFDQKNTRTLNIVEFQKLHEFLMSVTSSFSYYDVNKDQTLHQTEVTAALKQAGFTLDAPVVQGMMKKYDISNSTNLRLDEYIRMCLFLQSCVRTFGAFDTTKSGKITLDFNQFVYASSHISS